MNYKLSNIESGGAVGMDAFFEDNPRVVSPVGMAMKEAAERDLMERLWLDLKDWPHSTVSEAHQHATQKPPGKRAPMSHMDKSKVQKALDTLVTQGSVVKSGKTYEALGRKPKGKQASRPPRVKVGSLSTLNDFRRINAETLINKATQDLWAIGKDGEDFYIERLFQDNGSPLKG